MPDTSLSDKLQALKGVIIKHWGEIPAEIAETLRDLADSIDPPTPPPPVVPGFEAA